MSESDSPQAIDPCELHAQESQRLQPDCPYVTGTVTRYCTLTPFTLTDAEREALHWFAHYGLPEHRAATLRGLLERTR